ncbi:hypothetical protein ACH5RR_032693 [Cinchona calisaya]|uniref:Uncharacterized protein n=1 Tax=Cinchona calisaya TaxID=153742 RepID=A0ABD2YKV4_9GENT
MQRLTHEAFGNINSTRAIHGIEEDFEFGLELENDVACDEETTNFFKLLKHAEVELFKGYKSFTFISFLNRLLHMKSLCQWSNNSMTMLLELLRKAFLENEVEKLEISSNDNDYHKEVPYLAAGPAKSHHFKSMPNQIPLLDHNEQTDPKPGSDSSSDLEAIIGYFDGPMNDDSSSEDGILVKDGNKLPLTYTDWRAIPEGFKERFWEDTKVILVITNIVYFLCYILFVYFVYSDVFFTNGETQLLMTRAKKNKCIELANCVKIANQK